MTTQTTSAPMTEQEIFGMFEQTGPAATISPAELKAQGLYYKVRGGRLTFQSAQAKMPKCAAAKPWAARMAAEFGA